MRIAAGLRLGLPLALVFMSAIFVAAESAVAQDGSDEAAAGMSRDYSRLDVSVAVFDPGVPEDISVHRDLDVFPRIRKIEALFLPFVLRDTLVRTDEWGAVRVVPEPDVSAELLVTGRIVSSDGNMLELHVLAADASGRVWLDKPFIGIVTDDYADTDDGAAAEVTLSYQKLYDDISTELLAVRDVLGAQDLERISEISLLRYAYKLAPAAFQGFVTDLPEGGVRIDRLPAKNDPMLGRIALVRSTEWVITDAIDTKFRELRAEIATVYNAWRKFRRKSVQYAQEDARRARDTRSVGEPGSYKAITNSYDNYKYHRVTEQEQDRLAVAFINEAGPTIEFIESRVAELEAWVELKYIEWRRILEELFEVETGG